VRRVSRARGAALPAVLAALLCAAAPPPSMAAKPEPPLGVTLRVVSAEPDRGRYRLEVTLSAAVALEGASLTVEVRPAAGVPALQAASRRHSVEPVAVPRGRGVRRVIEVLTLPHEPVTVLVGLGGRMGRHRLHRTAGVDLGERVDPAPRGRLRTDQHGQVYYEVPLRPREER
jgi:hypothetical protein